MFALSAMLVLLGFACVILGLEVRRVGVERDLTQRMYQELVQRLAARPETTLLPPVNDLPAPQPQTYVSDLPYHDELWDSQFREANEAPPQPDEDDE